MKVTLKQQQLLDTIQSFIREHHYAPTVRELTALMGWKSSSTAHGCLTQLKKKGLLGWEPERPRTMQILNAG